MDQPPGAWPAIEGKWPRLSLSQGPRAGRSAAALSLELSSEVLFGGTARLEEGRCRRQPWLHHGRALEKFGKGFVAGRR